jgi:hypothetical protein
MKGGFMKKHLNKNELVAIFKEVTKHLVENPEFYYYHDNSRMLIGDMQALSSKTKYNENNVCLVYCPNPEYFEKLIRDKIEKCVEYVVAIVMANSVLLDDDNKFNIIFQHEYTTVVENGKNMKVDIVIIKTNCIK